MEEDKKALCFLRDRVGFTYYSDDTTPKDVQASVDSTVSVLTQFAQVHSLETVKAIKAALADVPLTSEQLDLIDNAYPIENII